MFFLYDCQWVCVSVCQWVCDKRSCVSCQDRLWKNTQPDLQCIETNNTYQTKSIFLYKSRCRVLMWSKWSLHVMIDVINRTMSTANNILNIYFIDESGRLLFTLGGGPRELKVDRLLEAIYSSDPVYTRLANANGLRLLLTTLTYPMELTITVVRRRNPTSFDRMSTCMRSNQKAFM
jgi:hypothetical protein